MSWACRQEGGHTRPLRLLLWLALHIGRHGAPLLLWPAALWYLLTARPAGAASRAYLTRALGRPAAAADVLRHFHSFASVTLDRIFLLTGRLGGYRIEDHGLHLLTETLAKGRGCILLGAHLGSFEALRTLSHRSPVPVRMLMYKRNDGALTRLLDALSPGLRDSVIEIGTPESMLRVREAVAAGGVVGILADRAPADQKMVQVTFLGATARLPTGPMIVASVLGAPVLLCWAVRTGPCAYRITIEPFADEVRLARATRQADLQGWVARYAARLAEACQAAPFNWFNFYDFWETSDHAAAPARLDPGTPAAVLPVDGLGAKPGFLPDHRVIGAS